MNNTIDVQVCGNQGMFPCTYKTVVLKPNIVNDKNILNQGMMNMPNTKYVIKYDFLISDAIIEKTANVVSTNVSHCGNSAYATALANYNAAHEAWIEADNAYTNNPNDTTLAAKNAAYAALEAAQLVLNGTPQYYYFASGAITLKKGQYVSIPDGCVLLNNSLNGVVDFILAPNNTTVYIANAVIGNYNYKIMSGIEMPANCLIEFDGGSISDGVLVGDETILIYDQEVDVVLKNVTLLGTFEQEEGSVNVNKKDNTNGMAIITLKKSKGFAEQLTKGNTIYRILYDFDLNGEEVTVPANCVLLFEGGSLSNGTISGNNTSIEAGLTKIFNTDITFSGTWNVSEAYPEWFGAEENANCTSAFAQITAFCKNTNVKTIKLGEKIYYTDKIELCDSFSLVGTNRRGSIIQSYNEVLDSPIVCSDELGGGYITIRDVTIKTEGLRTEYTVKIVNKHSTTIENCIIVKNTKIDSIIDKNGIFIGRTEGYTGNIFMTRFIRNRVNQCCVTIEGTDGYIAFNEIWGINCPFGLRLDKTGNHMITANQIIGGENGCIYITNWSEGLKIYGNYFDGSSGEGAVLVPFGIKSIGSMYNDIIANNNFWRIGGTAISFKYSDNDLFTGNVFQDCDLGNEGNPDIYIENIRNTSIENNQFTRTNLVERTVTSSPIVIDNYRTGAFEAIMIIGNSLKGKEYYKKCSYPAQDSNVYAVVRTYNNNNDFFSSSKNFIYPNLHKTIGDILYDGEELGFDKPVLFVYDGNDISRRIDNIKVINSTSLTGNNKFDFSKVYNFDFNLGITSYNSVNNPPNWITGGTYIFNRVLATGYTLQFVFGPNGIKYRVCTNNSYGSWKEYDNASDGVRRKGNTNQRPSSANIYIGFCYIDESLGNKPIWWDGTNWVDATGATV